MTPSRGLHSDITTELAKGAYTSIHLVDLTLGTVATPVLYYYTDHTSDIVVGGNTYLASGFLQNFGAVKEDKKMTTGIMNLVLSAVNQTIISDVLTNGYIHRPVKIQRAYLTSANVLVSSNAVFTVYDGRIDGMSIQDSGTTSVVTFKVANHWAFFQRIQGRRTTKNSMDEHFKGDLGFDWMQPSNVGAQNGIPSDVSTSWRNYSPMSW